MWRISCAITALAAVILWAVDTALILLGVNVLAPMAGAHLPSMGLGEAVFIGAMVMGLSIGVSVISGE